MKELVERRLSDERVAGMVAESVQVIGFAEVGAQGCSQCVILLSEDDACVYRESSGFAVTCDGERYGSGLDIEKLYPIAPFLKDFLGTSMATTKRGNFRFGNGEWIHLDARVGNHFFIRANLIDEFLRRFEKIPKGRICREGLAVAIDILREGATTSSS